MQAAVEWDALLSSHDPLPGNARAGARARAFDGGPAQAREAHVNTGYGYSKICGVLFSTSTAAQTRRCFARGQHRYAGRCREHADVEVGQVVVRKPRPRCGFHSTWNGTPCSNYVVQPGERCGRHDENALANAARRAREGIEQRIEQVTLRRDLLNLELGKLRDKLASLTPLRREAAE